jgi:tRNA threonylcarbamoyladenosine biosynthesis protein TsaE
MLINHTTKNYKETQKFGEDFVKEVLKTVASAQGSGEPKAVVLGLQGNLGGGKTTFLQGFAKGLGIKEKILSPTFVVLKYFKITKSKFKKFYHIDCYRLKNENDILELGFEGIISNPENIVAIEWPEKIKKVLPKDTIYIKFACLESSRRVDKDKREIIFKK